MNKPPILVFAVLAVCMLGNLYSLLNAKDAIAKAKKVEQKTDFRAEMLKRHYPHGIHKLRTNKNDASIIWRSETLSDGEVIRLTQTYASPNDLKTALRTKALHKKAYIEIAGMWDHDSAPDTDERNNEAVLRVLREKGYEEARYANLKKYYGPHGHHFIDAIRADGKILWTSSTIQMKRVIHTKRELASLEEFKKIFLAAKVGKTAQIEVHLRPVKFEGAYARAAASLKFIRQEGYERAGEISN